MTRVTDDAFPVLGTVPGQELATAVQYGATRLVSIVVDNAGPSDP